MHHLNAPSTTPSTRAPSTAIRPEIQGLRAVAVLFVVLYHLWPGRLHGGYIGVDVFFVISGFLITSHLLREVEATGRVRLGQFWARRARRLLPAAYLVLATTAVAILLWVPRLAWQQFFKEIGASVLYVENWSLAHDSVDYLASSNDPSPVQHYWTLSAEEQFYIVWPLLILAAIGLAKLGFGRRSWIVIVLGGTTLASLAYSLFETTANPSAAYFITPTRAWEFGAGALLAFVTSRRDYPAPGARAILSLAGLAGLLWCAWTFTDATPMPGVGAVAVVVATTAVIAAGDPPQRWSPTRLLSLRPAQFLGDISYSMYLWHWPMIVVLPYVLGHRLAFTPRLGILAATIVVSWLTKRFVEDPVRTGRRFGLKRSPVTFGLALLGAAVLVAVSGLAWQTVQRETDRQVATATHLAAHPPPCFGAAAMAPDSSHCPNPALADSLVPDPTAAAGDYASYPWCSKQMTETPLRGCAFGDATDRSIPHVALIGDSHLRAMMPAFERLVSAHLLTVDLFTSGGCDWATGDPPIVTPALNKQCADYRAKLEPLLAKTAKNYDFIVTTSWISLLKGSHADRVQNLVDAWTPVAAQGVPIIAIRDNPAAGISAKDNPNICLAKVPPDQANAKCSLNRADALESVFDPYRHAVRQTPHAKYIDMSAFYCDSTTCPVDIGGVNVYRDMSHVSVTYAKTLAPYYYQALVDAGMLKA